MARPSIQFSVLAVEKHPNALGDVQLGIKVESGGFAGGVVVYVAAADMAAFLAGLRSLYKKLEGEANLESMSPGELQLAVRRSDSQGHLRVEGSIAARVFPDNSRSYDHVLSFAIAWEFEELREIAGDIQQQIDGKARATPPCSPVRPV